jgi:hypothetical protein
MSDATTTTTTTTAAPAAPAKGKKDADPVAYRFHADRGFFHGVPQRDLTERDVARLSPERRKDVAAGTVYTAVEAKK